MTDQPINDEPTPCFGTLLQRICWAPGQRHRTPVPAGLAPRLLVQLQGDCLYRSERRVQEVRPGDLCLDGGAFRYVRQAPGTGEGELYQVWVPADLHFGLEGDPADGESVRWLQRAWRERFGAILPSGSTARDPVLAWHRRMLLAAPAAPEPVARLEAEARARQAALALLEPLRSPGGRPRSGPEVQVELLEALARARGLIAARFTDPSFRMPQAAEAACLSPGHFSFLFHRLTGLTVQQYLLRLRLEQARLLLRHSALSIADVCYESGFQHLSHFAAMFRREFGRSPSRERGDAETATRCFTLALQVLPGSRSPAPAAAHALPLYVRRGSALYLTHLALAHRGTASTEALDRLRPFLRRPDRRATAVRLIGVICEGAGEPGVAAIHRAFDGSGDAEPAMPLALGEALRGRPWAEVAAALGPYLTGPAVAPAARQYAVRALGAALRDTAEERFFTWAPALFRTGDGILDNRGVVTLGFIFRGSAHPRAMAMLSGCLAEGLAREVHDHTQSPACLCTASEALALVCRGTSQAAAAAERITPLLASRDPNNVHDGVHALCRLFTGRAPDGLELLRPHVIEGRFPPLLALFDGTPAGRVLPAIEWLWSDPSPMLRRTIALALGMVYQATGDSRARALLEDAARRGAPKLAGDALLALGLVEHAWGSDWLFALARERARPAQPYLTRSALLAAGLGFQGTGDGEVIGWIAPFAAAENRYVAAAAILALGLVGQGTRNPTLGARIQEISRRSRRLANDADQALLMLEFDVEALDLLARWHGHLPVGQYASSFTLALRCFARRPGGRWDVDEPHRIG